MKSGFWSDLWQTFFAWPSGGVWSNLLASAIWGSGAVAFTLWRVKHHLDLKHNTLLDKIKQEYKHIDKEHLHDVLPDLGDHTDEVDPQ